MYDFKKDGVTQTLLGAYMMCPQRFKLVTGGLAKPESRSMMFGSYFHSLLEQHYSGRKPDVDGWTFPQLTAPNDVEYMRCCAAALLPGYVSRWAVEDKRWLGVQPEKVFDVKFHGYRLRGKIDGIVNTGTGVYLLETKTKSVISEDNLTNRLALDWQSLFYMHAWAIEAGGDVPQGVIYNVIRFPQRTMKNAREFTDTLRKEVASKPEYYFYRWTVEFSTEDIEAFRVELHQKLMELEQRKVWFKNQCACEAPYPCDYVRLCAEGDRKTGLVKRKLFSELAS